MRRLHLANGCSVLLLALLVSSSPAFAGSIFPNIWYEFGFDPNHAPFVAGCQPADASGVPCRPGIGTVNLDTPGWTFTSSTVVAFTTTDGFLAGDFFDVFDLGTLIGSTPAVPLNGHSCGLDPRVCVADAQISHASFLLPAGPHSISIVAHPVQILGEGFFEFTAVPEPSSFLLVIASLVWMWRRSRRRSSEPARLPARDN
jgi:hypothetical protein